MTWLHFIDIVIPILGTIVAAGIGFMAKELRSMRLEIVVMQTQLRTLTENGIMAKQQELEERVSRIEGRCEAFQYQVLTEEKT